MNTGLHVYTGRTNVVSAQLSSAENKALALKPLSSWLMNGIPSIISLFIPQLTKHKDLGKEWVTCRWQTARYSPSHSSLSREPVANTWPLAGAQNLRRYKKMH